MVTPIPNSPDPQLPAPPAYSLFSQKAIDVATFLGGVFAGTLLISVNYHRIGKKQLRNQTIIGGILVTLLTSWIIFSIPNPIADRIPNFVYAAFNVALVHLASSKLLQKRLEQHFLAGGAKASNWSTVGYSAIGLVVTLACLVLYLPMVKPFDFEGEATVYGIKKHEIYHPAALPEEPIRILGTLLFETEYFNNDYQAFAQIKELPDRYEVSLGFGRDYWHEPELLAYLLELRQILTAELGKKTDIYLVDDGFSRTYRENLDNIHTTPTTPTPQP